LAVVPSAAPSAKPGLIPLEREFQERLIWYIRLRWMAVAGILLGAWGVTSFIVVELSPLPLYAVGLVVICYNALFSLFRPRFESESVAPHLYKFSVYAQIGLDWIALICLVHYTGGIQSPVVLAFTFHVIIGAILLSRRACYLQAVLASLLLGALVVVEQLGIWAPAAIAPLGSHSLCGPLGCLFRWLSLSGFLGVTAFLTTSIIQPLRQKEEALFSSERALDRAYGKMETLYQVGQAVNATLDVEQVLGLIAENGARLMGMKACSIRLLDARGKHLEFGAASGLSQAYLDKGPVEVEKSQINAEALSGRVVQIAGVASDPRFQYPEAAQREGIRSAIVVPMQAKGRSIGCIHVYSGQPHQFSRAEENFLRNLANLGAVAIENARAYADLQVLNEERAWFARVTHHQLRSPLVAIQSMLDALPFAGSLNEKQGYLSERARSRVKEVLEMIRDLLDLAAAQRPLAGQQAEPVLLSDSLEEVLKGVRERAGLKKVHLEADVSGAVVHAEVGDVERIFSNLLDNAVKYTPPEGTVAFQVKVEDNRVLATVSDTGIGIEPADQERIFQGFYRSQAAKASGETGTGMGLSIVRKLVERWGGELELRSAPGQGSRFVVSLPGEAAESGR